MSASAIKQHVSLLVLPATRGRLEALFTETEMSYLTDDQQVNRVLDLAESSAEVEVANTIETMIETNQKDMDRLKSKHGRELQAMKNEVKMMKDKLESLYLHRIALGGAVAFLGVVLLAVVFSRF